MEENLKVFANGRQPQYVEDDIKLENKLNFFSIGGLDFNLGKACLASPSLS